MHVIIGVAQENGDSVTEFFRQVSELAGHVGPGWALVLVLAVCLFMPRIGVVPQIASLIAADRIDKRKRTVESQRLMTKYQGRPQQNLPLAPPPRRPRTLPRSGKKK